MREVAEELEALALEAPLGSELAEALSRAAATAESMSLAAEEEGLDLDPERQAAEQAGSTGRGASDERERGAEGAGDGGPVRRPMEPGAAGADGSGPLGSADSEPLGVTEPLADEAPSGGPAVESATRMVLELNWWEPRDEGLVSRWVALQRAAGTQGQSGQ